MAAQRVARIMDDFMMFVEGWMLEVEKWNGFETDVMRRLNWSVLLYIRRETAWRE
jgi:hypothetical protein